MLRRRDLANNQRTQYDANNFLTVRDDLIYKKLDTVNDLTGSNIATSTDVSIGTTSVNFSNGYIELDLNSELSISWKLQVWVKPDANKTFPILSLSSNLLFSIVLDETLNTVTLLYSPVPGDVVTISKPMQVTSSWTFITIIRDAATLSIYSNLIKVAEFSDVFYPSNTGDLFFGKDLISSNHFNGKAQSLLLELVYDNSSTFLDNIDIYKKYYMPTTQAINASSIVLSSSADYSEGTSIYPSKGLFTYFDYIQQSYVIAPSNDGLNYYDNPRGLLVVKEEDAYHPENFLLDIEFELFSTGASISDCVICSGYNNFYNNGFYLVHQAGEIKFIYYLEGSNVKNTNTIGVYIPGSTVDVTIENKDTYVKIYYNGTEVLSIPNSLVFPLALLYKFNYNSQGILNTNTFVRLLKFTVFDLLGTYTPSDTSYVLGGSVFYKKYASEAFRLHQISDRVSTKKAFIPFVVTSATLQPGNSVNIVITQSEYSYPLVYSVKAKFPEYTDLSMSDVLYQDNFTINAGVLTQNLPVSLNLFTKQKKATYVDLEISNGTFSAISRITIDNNTEAANSIFKINGYVEGILSKNNLQGFDSVNGTTSAPKISTTLYGDAYRISSSSQKITLSSTLNNVRTVFIAYHELGAVANRIYVGNTSDYTFNGGSNLQLVGNLVVDSSDLLLVREDTKIIRQIAISADDSVIVRANESDNTIEVLRKINNSWNAGTPAIALNLQLQTNSSIDNCSIDITPDGNIIVLGFPSANNGEGVVQVWKYTTQWVKELHLGSPVPSPTSGGFGRNVGITNDGFTIAVAEYGSKNCYLYKKSTSWENAPFQTIASSNIPIQVSINNSKLLISYSNSTAQSYTKVTNSSWTVSDSFSNVGNCLVDKLSTKFLLGDLFSGTVKIRDFTSPSSNIATLTGTVLYFGYAIKILNGVVTISNPFNKTVQQYLPTNYNLSRTIANSSDDYGMYLAASESSIITTNYSNVFTIHTSSSFGYPERVDSTYVDGQSVSKNTILTTSNVRIYAFTTLIPLSINEIGSGYGANFGASSLNGLFLGALFYNRVLTTTEIVDITNKLKRKLDINELKLAN